MDKTMLLSIVVAAILIAGFLVASDRDEESVAGSVLKPDSRASSEEADQDKVIMTDAEWRELLSPEEYRVTRKHGTEPAFSGMYHDFKGEGIYTCVCCGNPLFSSEHKFTSGTGWPSFWTTIDHGRVAERTDYALLMSRTEVSCSRCDAHLGHLFDDGPPPTGLRYCINSVALDFVAMKINDSNSTGGE